MNPWIKKSIETVRIGGYLDKLKNDVYYIKQNPRRPLSGRKVGKLKQLYDEKRDLELLENLLEQQKFPIENSYIAFLRNVKKNSDLWQTVVESNPEIINVICKMIRSLEVGNLTGFEAMIYGIEQPKSSSRQVGPMFRNFLPQLDFPLLQENEFKNSKKGIVILDSSDAGLKKFARENLNYQLTKGLDLVAKVNNKYVIGETKFLTDFGGTQLQQFRAAINLVDQYNGPAIAIAILDGVVWLENNGEMYHTVSKHEKPILSVLLLGKFLENLR